MLSKVTDLRLTPSRSRFLPLSPCQEDCGRIQAKLVKNPTRRTARQCHSRSRCAVHAVVMLSTPPRGQTRGFWKRVSNVGVFFCFFFCMSQGREDQAEETLLQLIRDPYNLGDASWTPESAAETAEWRRLEVCMNVAFFFVACFLSVSYTHLTLPTKA